MLTIKGISGFQCVHLPSSEYLTIFRTLDHSREGFIEYSFPASGKEFWKTVSMEEFVEVHRCIEKTEVER